MKGISTIQLALCTVVLVLAIPFAAFGADGQIKLTQPSSFPIVIDKSGSYVLTSDIVVSTINEEGIQIDADNVTLDLNGHALIGPGKESGTTGTGINALSRGNIAVINGTVRDFSGDGISIIGSKNIQLKDIRVYNNGVNGIYASSSTITNCTANSNGENGIYAYSSTITNCTSISNVLHGISAVNCTITNCTAGFNDFDGINPTDSTITNCTAKGNSTGIYAFRCIITNCTANYNEYSGIVAKEKCRVEGNNLRFNGQSTTGYGLHLLSHSYAIKNVASDNADGNFFAVGTNYMPTTGIDANYGF
jgi:hypothetical protein